MKNQVHALFSLFILIPFIASSQVTFQKTYGGIDEDWGYDVQKTPDGGYILAGWTDNFSSSVGSDAYLIKTNAYGDTLWTKTYSTIGSENAYTVQLTSDGGYVFAGFVGGSYYTVKTDSIGNKIWACAGGTGPTIEGYAVKQTLDGGYLVSGSVPSIVTLKLNSSGNAVWKKNYGNASGSYCIELTPDSGFVLASSNNSRLYMIKANANGDTLWTRAYGGTGAFAELAYSVKQTSDGGFILAGQTMSFGAGGLDVYLVKTDAAGNLQWSKTYGGAQQDIGRSVVQAADGGYIIAGTTRSFNVAQTTDVYLIRTDANGTLLWSRTFGGTSNDEATAVQEAADGGCVVIGTLSNGGLNGNNVYFIKTDSLGNSGCNQGIPATVETTPATQVTNPPTTVLNSSISWNSVPATMSYGATVNTMCTSVGTAEQPPEKSFRLAPNPSSGIFTITFPEPVSNCKIEVYDMPGRKIIMEEFNYKSNIMINLHSNPAGMYFVKIYTGEKNYFSKLMLE